MYEYILSQFYYTFFYENLFYKTFRREINQILSWRKLHTTSPAERQLWTLLNTKT